MKQKTGVILFLTVIVAITIGLWLCFVAKQNELAPAPPNPAKKHDSAAAEVTDLAWNKYLNNEYGFTISYPNNFVSKINTSAVENVNFLCGKRLGDAFRIACGDSAESSVYEFAVYSNPTRLFEKDFLICQKKDSPEFNENKIKNINVLNLGKQKNTATEFILEDLSDIVLIRRDNYMYEFTLDKNSIGDKMPAEFGQILETIEFFEPNTMDETNFFDKLNDFCAEHARNEYGNGIFVSAFPITNNGRGSEFFTECAQKIIIEQTEWKSSKNVLMYHLIADENGIYQIAWEGSSGNTAKINNLNWTRLSGQFSAGDLNNDGMDEITLTGDTNNRSSNEANECSHRCNHWCLYIPAQKETKCVSNCSGWSESERIAADTKLKDCPIIKTEPGAAQDCTGDEYFTQCFDGDNVNGSSDDIYKKFLKEKADANIWPTE